MGRDLAADSDRNLWAMWRHFGLTTQQGHVEEDDDILIVETGSSLPTFNPVFIRRVPGSTVDDAAALVRRAIDRDLPVVVTVSPMVRDVNRLVTAAIATGLVERNPLPGMAMRDLPERERDGHARTAPAELVIHAVESPRQWTAYFEVLCAGFDVALEFVRPIIEPAVYRGPNIATFAGSVRGRIVTTSLAFVDGDVAGIYNVATLPAYRGRGYGEAMTRAALTWCRQQGCHVAVLQASEMGRSIYERMGFAEVVPYRQLVVPA